MYSSFLLSLSSCTFGSVATLASSLPFSLVTASRITTRHFTFFFISSNYHLISACKLAVDWNIPLLQWDGEDEALSHEQSFDISVILFFTVR